MSGQLIDVLKFGLLALLYLFFLRVIWAVWTELRTPALEAPAPPRRARAASRKRNDASRKRNDKAPAGAARELRVVEPPELVGTTYPLDAEMTMGRAPGCAIVIDDTYVSQLHARVFVSDGVPHIEDLGSTNGTFRNGHQVSAAQRLARGDRVQVGTLVLELT